jgi:hypothetical protein
MVQTIVIAVGAGLAAALLFLAPASGSTLAFPLFVLTGLPLAIATFGWGPLAGTGAAILAAVGIFAIYPESIVTAVMFLCLFGVPVVWLSWFAGASRPIGTGDTGLQRHDLGSDLVQLVATVVVAIVIAGLVSGYDSSALVDDATRAMLDVVNSLGSGPATTAEEIQPMVKVYIGLLPFVAALMLAAIFTVDLWIGALVARGSGRLTGDLSPLWSAELPMLLLPAFVVGLALAFFPGVVGELGKVIAGASFASFVLAGLALLHALTRGWSSRVPLLILCYLLLVFSGVPAILLAIAGVADVFLHLRQRRSVDRTPSH